MSEPDKILEAEAKILSFKSELEKLKNAATLLQENQKGTQALVEGAAKLISAVEAFAKPAGKAVEKLSEIQFRQKFDDLASDLHKISCDLQKILSRLESAAKENAKASEMERGFDALIQKSRECSQKAAHEVISSLSQQFDSGIRALSDRIEQSSSRIEEFYGHQYATNLAQDKKLKIIMVLSSVGLVLLLAYGGLSYFKIL